jgi:hypothetical protein
MFIDRAECSVGLDYHVEIDKHYYSVPHQLLREKVWARITARTIGFPLRQARCGACALVLRPQAYDGAGAHAVEPPALCRLDAGATEEAQEEARNLAHAEWLALLLDREAADRGTRRFQTRLRAARLRHSQATVEDVDYRTPRRLHEGAAPAAGHLPLGRRASRPVDHRAVRRG